MSQYHVLIVDDEVHAIRGVQAGVDWKQRNVSTVYTANNLSQAQEIFLNHQVDLLLCDIEMPKGSGIDLLKWVREHYQRTEAIFLTCHSDFSYAKQALQLQSFNYLLKPVDYKELEEVIDGAIEKIKKNQEVKEVEESYLRLKSSHNEAMINQFWSDVISQTIPSAQETIKKHMSNYGVSYPQYTAFIPVLVHVQRWKEDLSITEEKIMEYALQKVIDELYSSNYNNVHLQKLDAATNVIIISSKEAIDRKDLINLCNNFIVKFSQYYLCDLCCYIGLQTQIHEVVSMVSKLQDLNSNNVLHTNKTILYTKENKELSTIPILPTEEWGKLLKVGEKDKLFNKINEYINNWKKEGDKIRARSLHYFYQDFLQLIFYVLKVRGINANQVFSQNLLTQKPNEVLKSLNSLHDWVIYITDVAMNQLHSPQEKGSLVDIVKQYISENIGEHRLSREEIANYVYLNPDYLTRVFKKETGLSISDYLMEQRMEHAKELLQNTNLPISDIALSVGYSNFSYFSTIFKRTTKLNPKEYRKSVVKLEWSEK